MVKRAARVRPRRAKPRYPRGVVMSVVAAVVVVLVALGVFLASRMLGGQAAAPETEPAHDVAVSGAGPGAQWQLPERRWEPMPPPDPASPLHGMQANDLNAQPPAALTGCAAPATVETIEGWEAAVRAQWECVHRSWVPTLERLGWSATAPTVQFFRGEGDDSECGYLEAPAFYCSAGDGSVHFGARHFDMARIWKLSVNEMVNHEYGHHLQNLAGVTAAKVALPWTIELERRAELQATCWSAAMTAHNASFTFGQAEYGAWLERLDSMRAGGVHGSRESMLHWGTRGLYAKTMNDCNTWVVPETHVT
ncbi:MAG: hypothetical protein Q4G35_09460 [Propionibacteriaceae bacterium]|nr:hypothetical protein [Propionibacteriaceae bacterium]